MMNKTLLKNILITLSASFATFSPFIISDIIVSNKDINGHSLYKNQNVSKSNIGIWNEATAQIGGDMLHDEFIQDYINKIKDYGIFTKDSANTFLNGSSINNIIPHNDDFIVTTNTSLLRINSNGKYIEGTLQSAPQINDIIKIGNGNYMATGNDSTIYRIDSNFLFTSIEIPNLPNENIRKILYINDNEYLVSMSNGKVAIINSDGDVLKEKILNNGNEIYDIAKTENGFIVVGAKDTTQFISFDFRTTSQISNYLTIPGDTIDSIINYPIATGIQSDGDGNYFVFGTKGRFTKVDSKGVLVNGWNLMIKSNNKINDIMPSGDGNFIVVASFGEIYVIDKAGNKIKSLNNSETDNEEVTSVTFDGVSGYIFSKANGNIERTDMNGNVGSFNSWIKLDTDYDQYSDFLNNSWLTKTPLGAVELSVIEKIGNQYFVSTSENKSYLLSSDMTTTTEITQLSGIKINGIKNFNDKYLLPSDQGKIYQLDSQAEFMGLFTNETLLGGENVYDVEWSGNNEILVVGANGKFDRLMSDGTVINGWTTKTIFNGENIYLIKNLGNDNFFIGGANGFLDQINNDGNLTQGWITKTFLKGQDIKDIIVSGTGEYLIVGAGGNIDKIKTDGQLSNGWITKTFNTLESNNSITADGQGGFFISRGKGKIEFIDSVGTLWINENKSDTISRWNEFTQIAMNLDLSPLTISFSGESHNAIYDPVIDKFYSLPLEYRVFDQDGITVKRDWTLTKPTNLINNEYIQIRYQNHSNLIIFSGSEMSNLIKVSGLTRQVINVDASTFSPSFTGKEFLGTFTHDLEVFEQSPFLYKIYDETKTNVISNWSLALPSDLHTGMWIQIKYTKLNQIDFDFSGQEESPLVKVEGLSKISFSDVAVSYSGTAGSGTFDMTKLSKVKIEYKLTAKDSSLISDWSTTKPINLFNDNKLSLRFSEIDNTYYTSSTVTEIGPFNVSGLSVNMLTATAVSFQPIIKGAAESGTFAQLDTGQQNIVFEYYVIDKNGNIIHNWIKDVPSDLKNGYKIKSRLASADASNFEIDNVFESSYHTVMDLDKIKITSNFGDYKVTFSGENKFGVLEHNIIAPENTTLQFLLKSAGEKILQNWSSVVPSNLLNNQTIAIRLHSNDSLNYEIVGSNSIGPITIKGLKIKEESSSPLPWIIGSALIIAPIGIYLLSLYLAKRKLKKSF